MPHQEHTKRKHWWGITHADLWGNIETIILTTQYYLDGNSLCIDCMSNVSKF